MEIESVQCQPCRERWIWATFSQSTLHGPAKDFNNQPNATFSSAHPTFKYRNTGPPLLTFHETHDTNGRISAQTMWTKLHWFIYEIGQYGNDNSITWYSTPMRKEHHTKLAKKSARQWRANFHHIHILIQPLDEFLLRNPIGWNIYL